MPPIVHPRNFRPKTWNLAVLFGVFAIGSGAVFLLDSTADAQSPSPALVIQALTITQAGESANAVTYEAKVIIANSSMSDFSGIQRVDYQIDDGDKELAYIVTALPKGQTFTFTFSFELTPGERTIRLVVGDSVKMSTITVAGADIDVEITDYRFKAGRTVEFDLLIANSGDLTAKDLTLTSAWQESDGEVSGEQVYDKDIPDLEPGKNTSVTVPIRLAPGTYDFVFSGVTTTIEGEIGNNSAEISLDVEFIDLRTNVVATESLGWDGEGNAFISITVEVANQGVDDTNTFYIGVECDGEWADGCSTSSQSDEIPAGESVQTEIRLWLPIGDTPTRIFAVEDEETFRWGNRNAIDHIVEVPEAPELTWTLSSFATPGIASYWSDGSANVELDLTFLNNGTEETQVVLIECWRDDAVIEDCGSQITLELNPNIHPTAINQTLRLPSGNTELLLHYGAETSQPISANVPERIIGVDREIWECFSDTSYLVLQEADEDHDEGIGCGGWKDQYIIKWPVDETINVWIAGEPKHKEIFEEVLDELGPFLNLEFQYVASKSDAQLVVYAGWAESDAQTTGLGCIDFAGCARTSFDDDGRITASTIAIWQTSQSFDTDETRRDHSIRSTTLHELLHALANVEHRHHDRSSVMSYDALDYTTIDGIDLGLFQLLAHPMVKPGMTFDEVLELIVFSDELNDPPDPVELTAPALLRRAHAALMDAESFSFEVKGGWPGCRGNHDFGWAQLESANLLPHAALWRHFIDGNDRYYYIGNPYDWAGSEWWLRRGRNWSNTDVQRVSDATKFRSGFSSLIQAFADINAYATASDYTVTSRTADRVEIEVVMDQPNPSWSRGLNLKISIAVHPSNYQVLEYEMTWNFDPRNRDNCDTYTVRARSPQYTIDFTFPDAIRQDSQILVPEISPDETEGEVEVMIVN